MSFNSVPADLVLKIFHQLPFKDRIRLSGVNRMFKDVSVESIAKMKSLVVNDDLETYLVWTQTFSSLLESCSPTLESIDASSQSCPKSFINTLMEFFYPRLEHLEIRVTDGNIGQMNMLINRNRNLSSVILHLNCRFEWPNDIVFEKMEKLEIIVWRSNVDLSPTVRPLIGKIPNLKHLTIKSGPRVTDLSLSEEELSQLLASIPSLEELYLGLSSSRFLNLRLDVMANLPTWRLPKLTAFFLDLGCMFLPLPPPPILQHFPVSFPQLESFTSNTIDEIIDQDITASQAKYLQELRLPRLVTTKEKFSEMINAIPSITVLQICYISDVSSSEEFIDFLTSTAAIFHRDLVIHMADMPVNQSNSEWENVLEEIENNGGPTVRYKIDGNSLRIYSISFKSLNG